MKIEDFSSLDILSQTDLIRYFLKEDVLHLYVVGDNEEEEEEEPHPGKGEFGDELVESHHDADDGMNGHLFELVFTGVKDFSVIGNEADSYHTMTTEIKDHHLRLEYYGISFNEPNGDLVIEFSFDSYQVHDKGKIEGPDV